MEDGARTRHRVILAIETSCDDTCAAVVSEDGEIRSNVVASQGLLHARYGGVVPEIASRHHLELMDAVTADALERAGVRLDGIGTVAVTHGPGLIGALLVGLSSAKALAAVRRLPLVPVDHLHGHVVASTLGDEPSSRPICAWWRAAAIPSSRAWTIRRATRCSARRSTTPPARRSTRGRACSGSDTPAARPSTAWRAGATPRRSTFPAARQVSSTSASAASRRRCCTGSATSAERAESRAADLAASYQRAIVDALTARTRDALDREGLERLAIGGGVASNSELRAAVRELGVPVWVPPVELCTDNAAMIAGAARFLEPIAYPGYLGLDASARLA